MSDDDEEKIKRVFKNEMNALLVKMIVWMVLFGSANLSTIVAGTWVAANERSDIRQAISRNEQGINRLSERMANDRIDPWTATMEVFAEWQRANRNPGYIQASIRDIQREQENK